MDQPNDLAGGGNAGDNNRQVLDPNAGNPPVGAGARQQNDAATIQQLNAVVQRLSDQLNTLTTMVARGTHQSIPRTEDKDLLRPNIWDPAEVCDPTRRADLVRRLKALVHRHFDASQDAGAVRFDRIHLDTLAKTIELTLQDYASASVGGSVPSWPPETLKHSMEQLQFMIIRHRDGMDVAKVFKDNLHTAELPEEWREANNSMLRYMHDRNVARAARGVAGNGGGAGSAVRGRGGRGTSTGGRGGQAVGRGRGGAGAVRPDPAPDS